MTKVPLTTKQKNTISGLVYKLFKKYDKPFVPYDGQLWIMYSILEASLKWVWISAPTRYGKSESVALAALILAALGRLRIKIVGATMEKANKIMEYVTEHISDHELIYSTLLDKDIMDVEKLKLIRRKTELRWRDGGWISIVSAEADNAKAAGKKLLGEGGDVVIVEEAGLLKNKEVFNKIVRMREPDRGWGKLVLVGNLIEGTIFEKAYHDSSYYKVFITLEMAKQDKGWTDEFLEQQRKQMTTKDWKRLYAMEWVKGDEFIYFKPQKYKVLPPLERLEIYGGLDPALGEASKGSYTAIVVLGRDKETGQVYEVESVIGKLKPHDTIKEVLRLGRLYNFRRFFVEEVQYQKFLKDVMIEQSKREGVNVPIVGVKQTKNKQERIESLEPAVNTGQILFKGNNELWNELKAYPDADHVDGLDALELVHRNMRKKDWLVV